MSRNPRAGEAATTVVGTRFSPLELAMLDEVRSTGERRPDTLRRLVRAAFEAQETVLVADDRPLRAPVPATEQPLG